MRTRPDSLSGLVGFHVEMASILLFRMALKRAPYVAVNASRGSIGERTGQVPAGASESSEFSRGVRCCLRGGVLVSLSISFRKGRCGPEKVLVRLRFPVQNVTSSRQWRGVFLRPAPQKWSLKSVVETLG